MDRSPLSSAAIGSAGVVVLVVTLTFDRLLSSRSIAEEWPPDFSGPYLARSFGLALASVLLLVAARIKVCAVLPRSDRVPTTGGTNIGDALVVTAATVIAGLSVLLLYADPTLLNTFAEEDNIVEWASAVLAFVAGILCLLAAANHRRSQPRTTDGSMLMVLFGLLGAGFLLLGLEEVSWFQRVFDVESPDLFLNRNGQQETNLHNMATTSTGNAYYVGGFVVAVLIPALLGDRALPERWRRLEVAIPNDRVLLGSALAGGFVYEMWNVAWIQMILYLSLMAVVLVGLRGPPRPATVVALATAVTAVVFLTQGDRMVRSWDDTEIRELVIPFGLALYGLQAWRDSLGGPGPISPDASG